MKIVLASKSPRRRQLLSELYPDFEIVVVPTDESVPAGVSPFDAVRIISERKGLATYNHLMMERGEDYLSDTLIISSDTLVAYDDIPLGKPKDESDAKRMLRTLSGREHKVHTGVAVRLGERVCSGTDTTRVIFRSLTDEEIESYVKGGEPMDKAGSYGIQGEGGKFVKEYIGDFDTVVGLSVKLLRRLVEEIDVK
jgi:septum formation protein